jgi:hypothetical protein
MLFNFLSLIVILIFFFIFLLGILLIILGLFRKKKSNRILKAGLIVAGIPLSIFIAGCFISWFFTTFAMKPNQIQLVGTYHISKANVLDLPKSTFGNYKLEFRSDSTFSLTPVPNLEICQEGRYSVDYEFYYNELSFECDNDSHHAYYPAHIDRWLGCFRIELVRGDPDSGESIFFEKD